MITRQGQILTPATKEDATEYNYTWWNGEGAEPTGAGHVFFSKGGISEQIYRDFPDGVPLSVQGWPAHVGDYTVIGGDGFGWYGDPPKRFPHIGQVIFGLDVEVGSCVTIDRGSIGSTVIASHVKIDNGVHIGHNARIGRASILTAHCVIGGSAEIGENVWVGLGAQIKNQVTVGDGAVIGMGAIVVKDVPPGVTVVGNPARILE